MENKLEVLKKKTKTFICDDKDMRCGRIRFDDFGDGQTEVCYIPSGKRPRMKCVVLNNKEIIKFFSE